MSRADSMATWAIAFAADNSHGYSQEDRWGQDCDCSSFMYRAAHDGGGYDVPLGSGYTGTMLADFKAAGFTALEFDGNLYDNPVGTIFLNVADHTSMYVGDGNLVEASCSETGGITGQEGDQTGNEVHVRGVYNFPWDYVLIPPADSSPAAQTNNDDALQTYYAVKTAEDGWLPEVHGLDDFAGVRGHAIIDWYVRTNDGHSIDYSGADVGKDFLATVNSVNANTADATGGYAGDDAPLGKIKAYAHNDCKSGERAKYHVSPLGEDYLPWQYDYETCVNSDGQLQDGYAGDDRPFDRLQIC